LFPADGHEVRRVARWAGITKPVGPHAAACVHHRRARCWGPAAGCAGSRFPRWPTLHDGLWPGPHLAGPPRHLHRVRLRRRSRPVGRSRPGTCRPGRAPARRTTAGSTGR